MKALLSCEAEISGSFYKGDAAAARRDVGYDEAYALHLAIKLQDPTLLPSANKINKGKGRKEEREPAALLVGRRTLQRAPLSHFSTADMLARRIRQSTSETNSVKGGSLPSSVPVSCDTEPACKIPGS